MKRNKYLGWIRDIVIAAVLVGVVFAWQGRNLLDSDGSVVVPEQNFVTLGGQIFELDKTDRKTVMYFFAPWCSICRLSINNLNVLDPCEYRVVRVALDYTSKQEVEQFISQNSVEGEVVLGARSHKSDFNISGYPTYYVLDEGLNVIANDMGYSTSLGIKLRTSF